MKMHTKAIITVAIILSFVVATVTIILLFGNYDDKKHTTITSGLSSWTVDSQTKKPSINTSTESKTEQDTVTAEEQFIMAWNNVAKQLNFKKFNIEKYETVKNRMILIGLDSSTTSVVLDFTIDGELVMSIMNCKDRNEIAAITQVFYAMMTEDVINDTLSILVREKEEVSITISGCEFNANIISQKDSTFSATMKLKKSVIEE